MPLIQLAHYRVHFKCCMSKDHKAKDCSSHLKCYMCDSNWHSTALFASNGPTKQYGPSASGMTTPTAMSQSTLVANQGESADIHSTQICSSEYG